MYLRYQRNYPCIKYLEHIYFLLQTKITKNKQEKEINKKRNKQEKEINKKKK